MKNPFEKIEMIGSPDFDDIVKEVFKRPYRASADMEFAGQNTLCEIDVHEDIYTDEISSKSDSWYCPSVEEWLASPAENHASGEYQPRVGTIAAELRKHGYYIPNTFYLLIWW